MARSIVSDFFCSPCIHINLKRSNKVSSSQHRGAVLQSQRRVDIPWSIRRALWNCICETEEQLLQRNFCKINNTQPTIKSDKAHAWCTGQLRIASTFAVNGRICPRQPFSQGMSLQLSQTHTWPDLGSDAWGWWISTVVGVFRSANQQDE